MKTLNTPTFLLATAMALTPLAQSAANDETTTVYRVRQTVTLSEIPEGTKQVKWWIAIPDDNPDQKVFDLDVLSTPGPWKVTRELDNGNRFMLVEIDRPQTDQVNAEIEFTVKRRSVMMEIDPNLVGPITESHRGLFADALRLDEPHMGVTEGVAQWADDACGEESNVALQARLLLDAVADRTNHYSTDSTVPVCSIGDAEACMEKGGGCCTDLHSLFIAMARHKGIPARLQMGYRLREPNEGKKVDPGYRCWVEYFLPGYGWVPADIVEADDPNGFGRDRWFSGLTERRIWLNQGREFDLAGRQVTDKRVSTIVIGYAEIDGVEARTLPDDEAGIPAQLSRQVWYEELEPAGSLALSAR